jgi:hypothetical protein
MTLRYVHRVPEGFVIRNNCPASGAAQSFHCQLLSDDGSRLYIDGHQVADNDGQHAARGYPGVDSLKRGEHRIRVSYFQGPANEVALILAVIPPGDDDFSLFSTDDYLSPEALAEWKKSKPEDPQFSANPRPRRKPGEDFVMAPTISQRP